jgi:hypothetical protein
MKRETQFAGATATQVMRRRSCTPDVMSVISQSYGDIAVGVAWDRARKEITVRSGFS